ncbi:MAG: DUF1727 domain-containing protein [Eggerthellaceae bacterium]|nr:DUF1727 domain-containing protein [Eggerthellaceae bacterium]
MRFALAKVVSAVSTWGLKNVLHRQAGNFPGKMALYADPQLIAHLRTRLSEGSIVVVGTNGKTTVTNLLADALEASGKTVACNRGGANLDSGVATAMLQSKAAHWGVFESDELWLARILPQLQADYVVLLNLFRDQEDRMGGIGRIRESIVGALSASPKTTLIYTADDPQCAAIAQAVSNPSLAVGVGEDMDLERLGAQDGAVCLHCGAPLTYRMRQYDQLGEFVCVACGWERPKLDFAASNVQLGAGGSGLCFDVAEGQNRVASVRYGQGAPYLVYNLLSAFVAARAAGVSPQDFQRAADAFDPQNGRLQRYTVKGRPVLLNLAKNPTGFNENLRLVLADGAPKAAAFFVNDKEGDGRDVSWLNDVDFEALAAAGVSAVFAGGLRRTDVAQRLEKAGFNGVREIGGMQEVFAALDELGVPEGVGVYAIANYTALPEVKAELDRM